MAYAQNTPFRRYKAHTYEGGIATPLVVRWPAKIRPAQVTHQVGHIIDFLPTFLEAASGQYPTKNEKGDSLLLLEGISLLSVLTGENKKVERPNPLFWHWGGHRAVREGNLKVVWEKRGKSWELYDLSRNRTETRNLAKDQKAKAAELAKKWITWARMTGVKF